MGSPVPQFMSVAETAFALKLSKKTIRRMLRDGRLVAHRASGRVLVDAVSVTRLLSRYTTAATEPQMADDNQLSAKVVRQLPYTKEWTGMISGLEVALGSSDQDEARSRLIRAQAAWAQIEESEEELAALRSKCFLNQDRNDGWVLRHTVRGGKRVFKRISPVLVSQLEKPEDYEKSATKIPIQRRLFFGVLAREGMRVSELRELTWDDLELENGLLDLPENKTDDPRQWKMNEGVAEALRRWC
jgi:excisionase family DNA binding protein